MKTLVNLSENSQISTQTVRDVTGCSLNKRCCHRFPSAARCRSVCWGGRAVWVIVALTVCRGSHTIQEELIYFKDSSGCMKIKGGAGTQVEKTRWPFKHGQCCVARVFNGDRKGRRKTPLYMLFSIAACAIVLSLLPDRSPETEQERQGGGKEGHRGGLEQERGVLYPKRQSFGAPWVWSE